MEISPDESIIWQYGYLKVNLTILVTWVLMLFLVLGSFLLTRKFQKQGVYSRFYVTVEIIITFIVNQLKDIGVTSPQTYLPFIGTLFLFLSLSAILTIFPGYIPPTSSLSTTAAFAICVFVAVPLFGIRDQGVYGYLKTYFKPTPWMFPINVAGDFSRTLALAIRLFGNMMSGTMVLAITLGIAPLIFPVFLELLGLITGLVQAYIFTILSIVYIAAAIQSKDAKD